MTTKDEEKRYRVTLELEANAAQVILLSDSVFRGECPFGVIKNVNSPDKVANYKLMQALQIRIAYGG